MEGCDDMRIRKRLETVSREMDISSHGKFFLLRERDRLLPVTSVPLTDLLMH